MNIRILPSNIANMIAAGEVIQRPASVVKELMENAVDAGATEVTVVILDAGRTLIQVIDNGCGMDPDQAVLCFERHATSKILTAEDLMDIRTFGFRGEALASIAAVAEVTLKTREEGQDLGVQVEFADSQHLATEQVSTPVGSNFAVRNLFYNVPARRKFLKSDNVEFKHITNEFIRVALTRPEIGFTLIHNSKDIYVLKPAMSLKFRILDLLGSNVVNELVDIETSTSVVNILGYVGSPDMAKKGLGNQYLFVNGRFFRSPYLHKAVMKAYENLIPDGYTPSYFIYLDINPNSVDVNVHPTKTEIKFEDDSLVFQILMASIKETLGKHSFGDSIDFEADRSIDLPAFSSNFNEFRPIKEPSLDLDTSFNPFDTDPFPSETGSYIPKVTYPTTSKYVEKRDDYGKLFEDKLQPMNTVLVVQSKYIFATSRSGVMVINIKRAQERVFYERFLAAFSKNEHVSQTALFPVTVQVGIEGMTLIQEYEKELATVGYDIVPFGVDTVVVNAVPIGYSAEPGKVQAMIMDLLYVLADNQENLPELMASSLASKFAKLGSMSSSPIKNPAEAQALMDSLLSSENPEFTNSGQKIISILSIEELDKLF